MRKSLIVIAAGLLVSYGINPVLSEGARPRSNAQSDTAKYPPKDLPPPLPADEAKKDVKRARSNAKSDTTKYPPKDLPPMPPKDLPPKPAK